MHAGYCVHVAMLSSKQLLANLGESPESVHGTLFILSGVHQQPGSNLALTC